MDLLKESVNFFSMRADEGRTFKKSSSRKILKGGTLHTVLHMPYRDDYVPRMTFDGDPLVAAPPTEVPLANAPLVRVIAQVRFPEVLAVEQQDFVIPFQEAIREAYPILRRELTHGLIIGVNVPGAMPMKPQTVWRFADMKGQWRASLAPDFLALETKEYTSRVDFFARFQRLLEALDVHVEPKLLDRLGVRYIDRITGTAVDDIATLVRQEVRGLAGTVAAGHASHSFCETMFDLNGSQVVARWGCLPPNGTHEPATIEPSTEKSWVLDLDMFSSNAVPFEVDQILADAKGYSERLYTLFRWAVTDEFLTRYGGKP
ncbi:MAG TPA: TIGR04255 family protein [Polyangiaceae bacterium]|jgi:uncharacterized protein (TIGR04255 family)|nr:TIGR04255 family protein [Polyangiaceae bacterium]